MSKKFSPNWKDSIVKSEATIREVLSRISSSGLLVACFVEESGQLRAIMTDSDVRSALLRGAGLEDLALQWANSSPFVAPSFASPDELQRLARTKKIHEIPLVDGEGRFADVFIVSIRESKVSVENSTPSAPPSIPNALFILAGGLGTRLRPVVSDRPKPLAVVGDRPILRTLIERAVQCGFRRFYVSVNYMAEHIVAHLQQDCFRGLDIRIVREPQRLGTAGSIGLVAAEVDQPLLVCNSDILTTVSFDTLLKHHEQTGADITTAVRPFAITIPFGVVEIESNQISAVQEKPKLVHQVIAGLYVLSPSICRSIKKDVPLDMPDLIKGSIASGFSVSPFLLHEYCVDIGSPAEYTRANNEFESYFGGSKP